MTETFVLDWLLLLTMNKTLYKKIIEFFGGVGGERHIQALIRSSLPILLSSYVSTYQRFLKDEKWMIKSEK